MQDSITNLGLFKPNTDYYGRDYGTLAYHEYDVYDGYYGAPYDMFAANGPGPYPAHAYENLNDTNPFMGCSSFGSPEFSDPEIHNNLFAQQEEPSSEFSGEEYPSPMLDQPHLDPPMFTTIPYTPLLEKPAVEELESEPPTPKSIEGVLTLEDFRDILPANVSLAQKPHSTPLLPTDPESAVAQLHASPEMWEKACHTKKGVFICTNCHHNGKPLSFRTMIELALHFDSHGLMRKSKCEKKSCPWSVVGFSTRSEKNRHTKSQHSDLNFPCQTCGRRFGRCDSLKRHMKLVHDIVHAKKARKVQKKTQARVVPSSPASESEIEEEVEDSQLRWTNPQGYYSFVTRS